MEQLPECDYCERTDSIRQIGDNYVCPEHISELNKERIDANEVLRRSRDIDSHIQTSADVFNADTVAIVELEKAVDDDPAITNKPWAKAQVLLDRFTHFKNVQSDANKTIVDAVSKQRAIQQRLNVIANELRDEEREKLRLADLNYKPRNIKISVTAKTIRMSKQKLDNIALRRYAEELGIPEFSLRALAIQKNLTADGVYKLMKANLEAAKSINVAKTE